MHPESFYNSEELLILKPLLKKQIKIFKSHFRWKSASLDENKFSIKLGFDI